MADKRIIKFKSFSAGLAVSKFLGIAGSFAKAVGIDIHSEPGIIKAQWALAKDSGATVVDLITASVHTSSGHSYHFGNAGKIYKRTSGGTWSVLGTLDPVKKILGAAEHSDGYVYFTYSNLVGRIQVSDDALTVSWNTLTNTNTNYGPVVYHEKRDIIIIGNQELVATVSAASAFNANALDLLAKYEIRDIVPTDIDTLIGAVELGRKTKSRIFQWDGTSSSWQYSWFFGEEIKWMINKQEIILICAGDEGKIYDFTDLENSIAQIPGEYSSTATLESYPNAKTIFRGFLHFGAHDGGAGNPFPNGVYTFGTKNGRKFPRALNCEYVLSQNKVTAIEYGAISTDGSNLFVAWKDSTTYGMDKINFSARYGSAYIEFLVMRMNREIEKVFDRFPCAFKPLASGCRITLKQKLDHASSFSTVAVVGGQVTEVDTIVQPGGTLVNGSYTNVSTTKTEGSGDDALTVDVTIAGGAVTVITPNVGGSGYAVDDTITLTGLDAAGGGGDDLGTFDIKTLKVDETDDRGIFDGDNVIDGKMIQLRLDLTVSGSTTPEIEELGVVYDSEEFE